MNFRLRTILNSRIAQGAAAVILIAGIAWGSYSYGFTRGEKQTKNIVVAGMNNLESGKPNVDFGLFWQAWDLLRQKYVSGNNLDNQKLVYGSIQGLFSSLGDPNTVFFPPSDAKKFGEDISGRFSGIGAEIGKKNDAIVVISPLKNSPAEAAGLRPSDAILKIDATSTLGISIEEAVTRIRGPIGTPVVLNVLRDGWSSPRDIKIVRQTIEVPTVDTKMLDQNGKENAAGPIAYLHLYNFYEPAPYEFSRALVQVISKNPNGLILDLRDNPGGYLDAGVSIAGIFLPPNTLVVKEEGRGGETQEFKSRGNGSLQKLPLVVLINEGSASASEIVAGALHDDRGVKLIGNKSFGKGTVQEVDDLPGNALAKITIAHWLTPAGRLIDKNGLEPDYPVMRTDDDIKANKDPQLDKAVEVLRKML